MKAATYARYSTDMQREASIADQRRNLQRFAEREGWKIVEEFSDAGISGTKNNRPGYLAMLAAAKAKAFDVLLVDDLSRLSRDDIETKQTIRRLTFSGIRIIGVSDGYDSSTKGAKIQATVRGMMNEIYLDDLAEKTHRGQTGQALKGFNCGGRAYGYRHVPITDLSKLDQYGRPAVVAVTREIDPEQAKVIRRIFEWYADGHSPRWIAGELNRHGIPSPGSTWKRTTRRCNGWVASSIHGDPKKGTGILNNTLYAGRYVWNRSDWVKDPDTGSRKRMARPESEWIVVEDERLRIIPDKLWKRAQARRGERTNSPTQDIRPRAKFLLSGILKCGTCGSNFVMVSQYAYGCASFTNGSKHLCANDMRVSRRVVEERLLEGIKGELFTPEAQELFRREITRQMAERRRRTAPDAAQDERQLAKVQTEIENLTAAVMTGIHSPSLLAALAKAEAEKARLEASQRVDTKALDKMAEFLPRAMDRYRKLVDDLPAAMRDIARARAQIKTLLGGSVKLTPTKEGLVAELAGDFAGLLKLASGGGFNLSGSGGRI